MPSASIRCTVLSPSSTSANWVTRVGIRAASSFTWSGVHIAANTSKRPLTQVLALRATLKTARSAASRSTSRSRSITTVSSRACRRCAASKGESMANRSSDVICWNEPGSHARAPGFTSTSTRRCRRMVLCVALSAIAFAQVSAQGLNDVVKTDVAVPMRDGVRAARRHPVTGQGQPVPRTGLSHAVWQAKCPRGATRPSSAR